MRIDKEKLIEEMAKDIQNAVNGCAKYWAEVIAKYLTEQDYQKLPKNSVVLSGKQCVEIVQDNYNIGYERGSKETAENILNTEFFVFETENRSEEYQKGYMQAVRECRSRKDELAKQLDVEIKE